jgi:hypothetical protein
MEGFMKDSISPARTVCVKRFVRSSAFTRLRTGPSAAVSVTCDLGFKLDTSHFPLAPPDLGGYNETLVLEDDVFEAEGRWQMN